MGEQADDRLHAPDAAVPDRGVLGGREVAGTEQAGELRSQRFDLDPLLAGQLERDDHLGLEVPLWPIDMRNL
jgi:hypothetical protein